MTIELMKLKIEKKALKNPLLKELIKYVKEVKTLKEIQKIFGNREKITDYMFKKLRKLYLPKICLKSPNKNRNNKILLKNFNTLKYLREKYSFFLSYDGTDLSKKEKEAYYTLYNKEIWYNSYIKFELRKWIKINGKTTTELIHTFLNFHTLGSHSEKRTYIDNLYKIVWKWILKQEKTENKALYNEIVEQYNFYICADKHRAITSFLNEISIDSFISSNPTTIEKSESYNTQIKRKTYGTLSFEQFTKNNKNFITAIRTNELQSTKDMNKMNIDIEIKEIKTIKTLKPIEILN